MIPQTPEIPRIPNILDQKDLKADLGRFKKIFFYRICGTGMGAAACLLKEKGLDIEGGDTIYTPPMSDYLRSTKIPCHDLAVISDETLKSFDLIVVGNVVPRGGADALRIEALGVPFTSFPSALGAFVLDEKNVVGIAGTHGKTTTTYLLVQIFERLGLEPGYFIGGVLHDRPSSRLGKGEYFFIESDEYDSAYFHKVSKFHSYCIDHLLLTSLEYDHADIFKDLGEIENQFRQLIPHVPKSCIFSSDYPSANKLWEEFRMQSTERKWIPYGEKCPQGPRNIVQSPEETEFELEIAGRSTLFKTNLVGIQNVLNLSAAILFTHAQGISTEKIQKILAAGLEMVKRRQEVRGQYKNTLLIDDFAHHPRALQLTLEGIRKKYPDKKILAVFEPTSATARSGIFQEEFPEVLILADSLIIIKPARKGQIRDFPSLDCQRIIDRIQEIKRETGPKENNVQTSWVVETLAELRQKIDYYIENNQHQKTLMVTLSNGTLLGLWESLLDQNNQEHA